MTKRLPTSTQKEEPLECKESEELSVAAARSTEKRSSSMTKLTLTRNLLCLISLTNSAHDITFISMFFLYQDPPFKVIQVIMGGCKGRVCILLGSVDRTVEK